MTDRPGPTGGGRRRGSPAAFKFHVVTVTVGGYGSSRRAAEHASATARRGRRRRRRGSGTVTEAPADAPGVTLDSPGARTQAT